MFLIATDEAGYGPKLGPLVIAASLWEVTPPWEVSQDLLDAFSELARPVSIDGESYVVNDSKVVFHPKSARSKLGPPYAKLETITAAGLRWYDRSAGPIHLVSQLAPDDRDDINATPWLDRFAASTFETEPAAGLLAHWSAGRIRLRSIRARVITAAAFNRACRSGMNKSDLLSGVSLGLVKTLLDTAVPDSDNPIEVYCDRHGGRRYYAGVLQSTFGDTLVRVTSESKLESSYRVPIGKHEIGVRFTVKGDSFTPVAFSSIVAKYLREKAMESFNHYFACRHDRDSPLKPTAGYPVDADRFLDQVVPIVDREKIDHSDLVRSR